MSLSRERFPIPLTPVGGSSMLSPEERARREEDKLFDATVEARNREHRALIMEQIKADTRQITRRRALVALQDELEASRAFLDAVRLRREITQARRQAYHCPLCFVPFNILDDKGTLQINATKNHKCREGAGDQQCARDQDLARKKKADAAEAPTSGKVSRNGHRAHAR